MLGSEPSRFLLLRVNSTIQKGVPEFLELGFSIVWTLPTERGLAVAQYGLGECRSFPPRSPS